jgi:hypothetical protein
MLPPIAAPRPSSTRARLALDTRVPFLNNGGSPVKTAMLLLIILLSGVAHAQIDDVTLTVMHSPSLASKRSRNRLFQAVCVSSAGRRSASGGILSVAGVR